MADTKLDFMFKIVSDEDFIIFIEVVRLIYITNFSKISDFGPKWSRMKDSEIIFSGYFDQTKGYSDLSHWLDSDLIPRLLENFEN